MDIVENGDSMRRPKESVNRWVFARSFQRHILLVSSGVVIGNENRPSPSSPGHFAADEYETRSFCKISQQIDF